MPPLTAPPLRFMTCGSVDDGKSTLLGRLLVESHQVFDDQMRALDLDSPRHGTQGDRIDVALLLDGLEAEREQGITIDVAYRLFSTPRRRFIAMDAPGHEQYTRNMATAASTAELAILLVDARKGVLTQTRRHACIAAMFGIRHVVLAVNKMDLVAWDRGVFEAIVAEYAAFSGALGFLSVQAIPLCAVDGDNVVAASARAAWYAGPTLLAHLENVDTAADMSAGSGHARMPVQYVIRGSPDFRGYCGRLADGPLRVGDAVRVCPGGLTSRVETIVTGDGEEPMAMPGDSITLTLADDIDIGRGDVIAAAAAPLESAGQFEASVLWMAEQPLYAGRRYLIKIHTRETGAVVTAIKYRQAVDSDAHLAATALAKNEFGVVTFTSDQPVAFDSYRNSRRLGAFILIDRASNETAGAGMIAFALRRSANLHWQSLTVDKAARAALMRQRPRCVWLTGLSGAGKSTIANALEQRLHALGRHTIVLDGDNLRHGLNRDLGFTEAARVENIRRAAEVARLMLDAGLIVIVAFISPYQADRAFARSLFAPGEFYEVFVDTPIAECERRDPKGLYAKARRGDLKNFTGIDSAYEAPEAPDLRLDTAAHSAVECAARVVDELAL